MRKALGNGAQIETSTADCLQTVTFGLSYLQSFKQNSMIASIRPVHASTSMNYEELVEEMKKLDIADLLLIHRRNTLP